ncbi:MAG TPA: ABC transporter ATP-binding protein [Gemmatimonadales bacterium]
MIELQGLSKTYRSLFGARVVPALDDLTLTLARGEVVGVAGPNGAGKTTLLSLLLGYLSPTGGSLAIEGVSPRGWIERHGAGYLAELVAIPGRWPVDAALRRYATLARVPSGRVTERVDTLLQEFGLADQRAKRVRELSKGNLQRLGLAQALAGDSDFVILDEPTHGLDPLWTQRFRDVVHDLRRPSRLILIASHNLDELERLADRVLILHQGRLERVVTAGAGAAPAAGVEVTYRLALAAPHAALQPIFPAATAVEGRAAEWRVRGELAVLNRGLADLVAAGALVTAFGPEESRLESEFRAAVGGGR